MDHGKTAVNQLVTGGARGAVGEERRTSRLWKRMGLLVVFLVAAGSAVYQVLRRGRGDRAAAQSLGFRAESGELVGTAEAAELRYIEVAVAALSEPVAALPAPGRVVVADSRATPVVAPLAGRVEQVEVQLGDRVRAGDRLIAVRSASLPELNREIEVARAALAVKQASAARTRDLVALHAVPEKDLFMAQAEVQQAEIALRSAEGKRRSLRLDRVDPAGLYWLSAPRAGSVVARHALVGMEVGPDRAEPLLSIAELDEVTVIADLLESDVAGLKPGQMTTITCSSAGGPPVAGRVEYVSAVIDPIRRTVGVRVRAPNPGHRLRPNAFVQVGFVEADGTPRVVVPSDAIVTDGQESVIFVRLEKRPGEFHFIRRDVRVGRSRDGRTEIVTGLEPGETFVSRGAILLLNALDLQG
jgi:cobalt-zinc-cadmium efflux system membrane fusion protein